MNIIALHNQDKEVSAKMFFKGEKGMATAIQLHKTGILKEHVTQVPALLLCIKGKVMYQDETGKDTELNAGDYLQIPPKVKHWLEGREDAQLVLLK